MIPPELTDGSGETSNNNTDTRNNETYVRTARKKREAEGPPTGVEEGEQPEAISNELDFLYKFMKLTPTTRTMIGHQFEDFVKGCIFNSYECNDSRS